MPPTGSPAPNAAREGTAARGAARTSQVAEVAEVARAALERERAQPLSAGVGGSVDVSAVLDSFRQASAAAPATSQEVNPKPRNQPRRAGRSPSRQ